MRRRLAATGLAVLASLAFATTACTRVPGTVAPTKTATEILNDAAAKTKGQSFKYTLTYGDFVTGDGARDATGANLQRNITIKSGASGLTIVAKLLRVGDVIYAKFDLGALGSAIPGLGNVGDRWLVIDPNKVKGSGLSAALIPTGDSLTVDSYIKGVVSAEIVSATEIKGIIDLTKSAPTIVPASEVAKLGPETKNVPFTATLDGEGRITKIVINMPAISGFPASPLTTNYTDYGSAIEIAAPPAAQTVVAPETIYLFLP